MFFNGNPRGYTGRTCAVRCLLPGRSECYDPPRPIEEPASHPVVYRLASLGIGPSLGISYARFMHTVPVVGTGESIYNNKHVFDNDNYLLNCDIL